VDCVQLSAQLSPKVARVLASHFNSHKLTPETRLDWASIWNVFCPWWLSLVPRVLWVWN